MNKVALAILAHPDDVEFLCAGTLIRLIREQGWTVHAATMTPGDCGSAVNPPDEIAAIRRAEAKAGADFIGATYHCVEARDLRVHFTDELIERVVRLMAKTQPSIVLTHSPDDYHMDHEMTSKVVRAASFAAPIPNYLHGRWEGLKPLDHIPHLYYCDPLEGKDLFGRAIRPNFWIDITKQLPDKETMLACHASQRNWLLKHHGVDDYLIAMRSWAAKQGAAAGVASAEGFRQHLGHSYPQDNILGQLLGCVNAT
ncbi:PIG-L deacetylase family protein [Zavarzinella formosa]|uniref:PIG-L deacetylase family protein n=1 Tax=Zavarzinella formosa TaxID=360055 RepID=UPI0002D25A5F|nr:PIG-L deacetylase family protein [Zavarzinella formosa]